MTIFKVFERQAERPHALAVALSCTLMCAVGAHIAQTTFIHVTVTETFPPAYIPDFGFRGYTASDLATWYNTIGDRGRAVYTIINVADFLMIMPSYLMTLELGLISVKSPMVWLYLPLIIVACDMVESAPLFWASLSYPKTIPYPWIVKVICLATQAKFSLFVVVAFYILFRYVGGSAKSTSTTPLKND